MHGRALVLGAGGHAGIAWELGVLSGLADAGAPVHDADLVIGTSAGSIVGALITSGVSLDDLFQRHVDPARQTGESAPAIDFVQWRADFMRAREGSDEAAAVVKRFGVLARQVPTTTRDVRRRTIAARLPSSAWPPTRDLRIVAADVESGERRVFDRTSGVDLVDAIAASCAVPGIWPTVAVDGREYMDGGVYSIDNADLAIGCARVLILTLQARVPALCVQSLESAVEQLRQNGAQVEIVHPDEATLKAFGAVGGNLLDPAVREPAARAGREQGRRLSQSGPRLEAS
jgi:NTE family protein